MGGLLERHAPSTPTGRVVLGTLLLVVGVPGLVTAAVAVFDAALVVAAMLAVPSLPLAYLGYRLLRSVVRRAEETPEPDWWGGETVPDEADGTDPVTTLKRRYANGDLTTEEFEHRLDRLVESDTGRTDAAGTPPDEVTTPGERRQSDTDVPTHSDREPDPS